MDKKQAEKILKDIEKLMPILNEVALKWCRHAHSRCDSCPFKTRHRECGAGVFAGGLEEAEKKLREEVAEND